MTKRYKIVNEIIPGTGPCIKRVLDNAGIPIEQENRDCIQFLVDWKSGAEVFNADGTPLPYSDEAVIALGLDPVQ